MDSACSYKVYIDCQNETYINSFRVDLKTNEKFDLGFMPTDILHEQAQWLCADNNKYDDAAVDRNKVGKWMLFISIRQVNELWIKIRKGITEGKLWSSKITTTKPDSDRYAIMIYTKDYTDLKDVIQALDYLEEAKIKLTYKPIRYKADYQTLAGIYAGGTDRPWIYTSETVRSLLTEDTAPASSSTATNGSELTDLSPNASSGRGLYVLPAYRQQKPVLRNIQAIQPSAIASEESLTTTDSKPSQLSSSLLKPSAASSSSSDFDSSSRADDTSSASIAKDSSCPYEVYTTSENETIIDSFEINLKTNEKFDLGLMPTDISYEQAQ